MVLNQPLESITSCPALEFVAMINDDRPYPAKNTGNRTITIEHRTIFEQETMIIHHNNHSSRKETFTAIMYFPWFSGTSKQETRQVRVALAQRRLAKDTQAPTGWPLKWPLWPTKQKKLEVKHQINMV